MAQLILKQERPKLALASLEQALSHSFEIKSTPQFYLVKARIHEQLGEYEEGLKMLENALELPGVRPSIGNAGIYRYFGG